MTESRFLTRYATEGDDILVEVVLCAGTIFGLYRQITSGTVAVIGAVDRFKWSIPVPESAVDPEKEIILLHVPKSHDVASVSMIESFNKGRVVLRFSPDKN